MKSISSSIAAVALATTAVFAAPVQANLVTNGGFETGDFSGWTQTGDASFNGVQCAGPGASVYAGNCSAYFGSLEQSGIAQTIDVGSIGNFWSLSFAFMPDGGMPSSFTVSFGGKTLLSITDPVASDFMVYQFSGFTTAENMTLSFDFFDPVGFLSLDAVEVTAVPEPATTALMGAALAGLLAMRRRKAR
nr:PEP-CTERM sorting domain-containing protein [Variovorax boronicumulans]